MACDLQLPGVVAALLKLHADVNARDRHMQTALQLASARGNIDIATKLLDKHAVVQLQDGAVCSVLL